MMDRRLNPSFVRVCIAKCPSFKSMLLIICLLIWNRLRNIVIVNMDRSLILLREMMVRRRMRMMIFLERGLKGWRILIFQGMLILKVF
jgi:hypothetical protein